MFSVADLPEGPASDVYCFPFPGAQDPNYFADDIHFLQPLPVTTFTDPSAPDSVWWIGGQLVGTEEYLYWHTGRSGFVLTLIGAAGDGQADTAAVTVTLDKTAPSCVLKRG
jgi:hypothetical protein